ncbi:hypothetical protein [Chryseobacterium sp. CP-77]|uniref:hypothetical protein n=1 Tax=Chryseobacterium sp. CP-77 TaxID=3116594 RepID=UPI002ED2FCA0
MFLPFTFQDHEIRRILILSERKINLSSCNRIYDFISNFNCEVDFFMISERIKTFQEYVEKQLKFENKFINESRRAITKEITDSLNKEINSMMPDIILFLTDKNSVLNHIINDTNLSATLSDKYFFRLESKNND